MDQFNGASPEEGSSCVGIEPIDELLRLFRFPPPVQQHHAHPASEENSYEGDREEDTTPERPPRRMILPQRRAPVIEVTSPGSGDGKTSLLYYITAMGVLPPSLEGVPLGGNGGAVVFLDTDFRFDASRLRGALVGIAREKLRAQEVQHGGTQDESRKAFELMVNECLRHVHVFRPQSSLSLLATLRSLESYLLHSTQHSSHNRRLHAIVLDSASAFYWQDRRENELLNIPGVREERAAQQQPSSSTPSGLNNLSIPQIAQETVSALRHLQHIFSCAILYTTWGLHRSSTQRHAHDADLYSTPLSFRPHLPRPWPTFPTLRLVVSRDAVRPFAPFMTVKETERDAPSRQAIVARGEFSVWVDMWGRDNWAAGVAERVVQKGAFGFWVRGGAVGGFTM